MTLAEFLKTDIARKAILKTDFATCSIDDTVQNCLRQMREGDREWMGLIDDDYPSGGVARHEMEDAIASKKPEERRLVEESPVGPYGHALAIVGRQDDNAEDVARRLAYSNQPYLIVMEHDDRPLAVLPATALTENLPFRDQE